MTPEQVAQMDQMQAGLRDMADACLMVRDAFVAAGFTRHEAVGFTMAWWQDQLDRARDHEWTDDDVG